MSIVSKAQLKNDFLDGTIITEDKMDDLIDSTYNDYPEILEFDRTFVKSEIMNWGPTPIQILPDPGDNKIYYVTDILWVYKFVGDTYVSASDPMPDWIEVRTTGSGVILSMLESSLYDAATSELQFSKHNSSSWPHNITATGLNEGIEIGNSGATNIGETSAATDGTIRLTFKYQVIDLSSYWPV